MTQAFIIVADHARVYEDWHVVLAQRIWPNARVIWPAYALLRHLAFMRFQPCEVAAVVLE